MCLGRWGAYRGGADEDVVPGHVVPVLHVVEFIDVRDCLDQG